MKLNSGQSLATADESLVMMSLDQIKLVTLEAQSKAKVRSYGRELEFELTEGELFFNVTEKLTGDDKFDIRTSNMLCGIRGTSGFTGKDARGHDILMVTDGDVAVKAFNPVTKETKNTVVHAGEMITIYLDEEAEGDATVSFTCNKFREEDLPALALDAIRKDEALQERIRKATGFKIQKIIALAKVNSKKGVSMYGQAADDLAKAGIEDAIPVMGSPARDMIRTANRAVDVAKEDLDLEIAIIKGMKDVLDTGLAAGCQEEELTELMTNATDCVIDTVERAGRVGLKGEALSRVSASVSETLSNSVRDMKSAGLSRQEIHDVVEAIGTVYGNTMEEAKSNGLDSDGILSALDGASDFAKTTVNTEMKQEATGDETVIALLGRGGTDTAGGNDDDHDNTERSGNGEDTDTASANANGNGDDSDEGNDQTGAAGNNGNGNNANGNTGNNGNGRNTYTPPKNFTPGLLEPGIEPDVSDHVNAIDNTTGKLTLRDGTLFDPVYYAAANPEAFAKYGYNTNDLLYDYLNRKSSSTEDTPVYASIENKRAEEAAAYQAFAEEVAAEERARQEEETLVASAGGDSGEGGNESGESSGGSSGGGGGTSGGGGGIPAGTYEIQYDAQGNLYVNVNGTTVAYGGPATVGIAQAPPVMGAFARSTSAIALPVRAYDSATGTTETLQGGNPPSLVDWNNSEIGASTTYVVRDNGKGADCMVTITKSASGYDVEVDEFQNGNFSSHIPTTTYQDMTEITNRYPG